MQRKLLSIIICGLMIINVMPSIKISNSETNVDGAIMWYGHESRLVCIQLSSDGQTASFTESTLLQESGDPMPSNTFTSLTMIQDGSLILGTITGNSWPFVSKLYHIKSPQCNDSTSYAKLLGTMPEQIGIEALYTDASNRIYAMDTGEQVSSKEGNRLLRFTGDVLNGDFQFEVITDLSLSVPDIDGLGPGINKTNGMVVDTPGFAMDTYNVYNVDYVTGTFSYVGSSDGVYAIHAINGSWFSDGKSRLYVISGIPQAGEKLSTLYEINPDTGKTLQNLGSGPSGTGLTGPLPPGPSDFPDLIEPPFADAGPDQTVNEGDVVQFMGCNSSGSSNGVPPSVNPSVVALWHMDEGSGTTIYDETSNNNDGTINGPTWTTGRFGSALKFGDTDLVYKIPASFDDSITTNITVVAWVYWEGPHPGTYSPNSYIFDARDFEGIRGGFILYLDPSGTLIFLLLYGNNAGDYQIVQSTCKVPIKRWTHIAGVLDYTNGDLRLYINGNEDTSVPATEPYHDFGGSHWNAAIGNNRYAPGDQQWAPFKGIIDEVVIYNRGLTAQELPSTPAKIISYKWDFDESDGIDWDNPDATGPTPTHVYGDDGVYTVTLKIIDETNATDTDICNITVNNVAPTFDLSQNVTEEWVARYNGLANSKDKAYRITVDSSGNVYVTGISYGDGTDMDYATIKYDSIGNELWVARYNGPGNDYDCPNAIAVDSYDNIYVTGSSYGNGTNDDYATIKYNQNGNELWVARYHNYMHDRASAIAIDPSSGDVYVTGSSTNIKDNSDYVTIKYDSSGNELWVARYNGPVKGNDGANSISIDSSGNIYVTGHSRGIGTDNDFATIKYDSSGNELWVARYDGPVKGSDGALDMTIDLAGNVYVTGSITGIGFNRDYVTIKYDSNGNEQWVAQYNGPGNGDDIGNSIAIDPFGNVYVTGNSIGNGTNWDYTTIRYDSNGNELWVKRYDSPGNGSDHVRASALDLAGNVYVTGESGVYQKRDYVTIIYDSNGNEQWVAQYNGPGNGDDGGNSIAIDPFGNVYITGASKGNGTDWDYATIKYSSPTHYECDEGTPVTIAATASDTGSDDLTFIWNWGDGTPDTVTTYYNDGTGPEPIYDPTNNEIKSPWGTYPFNAADTVSHIYGDNGVYTITLTVKDDDGGVITCQINVTVNNVKPEIQPFGPFTIDEGSPINITGISTDPGSDDLTFTWTFEYGPTKTNVYYNDGIGPDPKTSPGGIFPFSATDTVTHTYGDDGVFNLTLTVEDDDGGISVYKTKIIVSNVNPIVVIKSITMDVEIGLRVAGRKYNNVSMTLYEDGNLIGNVSIERMPGSPNEQMVWIPVSINFSKTYSAIVIYTPEDPPNVGANPVWIHIKSQNGSINKIHHTFNVQQSKKRNSDHWNHIEPWEVDLNDHFIGLTFEITSHITDPGSDDLTLTYTYGSQTVTVTYQNNPPDPDPFPSPEVNPMDIIDITILVYEGPGTVTLVVKDDDNVRFGVGQGSDSIDLI